MDRAADGLVESGRALSALYEAVRQIAPEVLSRGDRALDALDRIATSAERAVDLAEKLSERVDLDG
jgi:hypothetical protein